MKFQYIQGLEFQLSNSSIFQVFQDVYEPWESFENMRRSLDNRVTEVADRTGDMAEQTSAFSYPNETCDAAETCDATEACDAAETCDATETCDAAKTCDATEDSDADETCDAIEACDATETCDAAGTCDAAETCDATEESDATETCDATEARLGESRVDNSLFEPGIRNYLPDHCWTETFDRTIPTRIDVNLPQVGLGRHKRPPDYCAA